VATILHDGGAPMQACARSVHGPRAVRVSARERVHECTRPGHVDGGPRGRHQDLPWSGERKNAVRIGEQYRRLGCGPDGERLAGLAAQRRARWPRVVEEPDGELQRNDADDRRVDQPAGQTALGKQPLHALGDVVVARRGEDDVHPRLDREGERGVGRLGHPVAFGEREHLVRRGHHHPGEAPFVAQQLLQQPGVGMQRYAVVDDGGRKHDRRACPDGRLARGQYAGAQRPLRPRVVHTLDGLACGSTHVRHDGGDRPAPETRRCALEPVHMSLRQLGGEHRVAAEAARDVGPCCALHRGRDRGGPRGVHPGVRQGARCRSGQLCRQVGVPRGRSGECEREGG
jgi:hypothetical protein